MDAYFDFTGLYDRNRDTLLPGAEYVSFRDLKETDLYCSDEAKAEIRRRIAGVSPSGVHFIDSGNFHYMTMFMTEKIDQPYGLVVFDHHTDMKPAAFGGMLSCGSWILNTLKEQENLMKVVLIGPPEKARQTIPQEMRDRIVFINEEVMRGKYNSGNDDFWAKVYEYTSGKNLYFSLDLDILDRRYAVTDWDQGTVSLRVLCRQTEILMKNSHVLGADICGGLKSPESGDAQTADTLNLQTAAQLYEQIHPFLE